MFYNGYIFIHIFGDDGMTEDGSISKVFEAIIIVNWKTGAMRLTKRKPKVSPLEVPIKVQLRLNTPKTPDILVKGEITIPQTKVDEMILETL